MENGSSSHRSTPDSTDVQSNHDDNDNLKKKSSSSGNGSKRRKTLGPGGDEDVKQDIGIRDSDETPNKKITTSRKSTVSSISDGSDHVNNDGHSSAESSGTGSGSNRRLTLAPIGDLTKHVANDGLSSEESSSMESGCNRTSTSWPKKEQIKEVNNDTEEGSRAKPSSTRRTTSSPRSKLDENEKHRDSQSNEESPNLKRDSSPMPTARSTGDPSKDVDLASQNLEKVDGVQSASQLEESKSQSRDSESNNSPSEQDVSVSQSSRELTQQSSGVKNVSSHTSAQSTKYQSNTGDSDRGKSDESFQSAPSRKSSSTERTDYQTNYFDTASQNISEEPKPRKESESNEDPMEQEVNHELEEELLEAVLDGEIETVKRLVEEGVSTEALCQLPGKEGLTPLLIAAWCGEAKIMKFLLESKANRKAMANGLSAVHYAATGGHVEVLQVLWNDGYNIKYRSSGGVSPLHLAAENGNLEAVQWFVEKGASLYIKDKNGFTPEELARDSGYKNVAKYLQEKREEMQMNDLTEKRELGRGTYGEVFLIKRNGKYLVLKSINLLGMPRKKLEYAHQEIKLLKSLSHPYIVSYVGGGFKGDYLYIQMEYCSGGDMYERIQQKKKKNIPFEEQQVVNWALRICLAIKYIHSRNILHRDIKPHNIFLTGDGVVKLGDFGLSKALGEDSKAMTSLGSPAYMSPEVFKGKPYDAAADMFSFGSVMFEMAALKGGWPYKQLEIPHFSQDYKDVVIALLQKNPQMRPRADDLLRRPIFHDALEIQVGEKDHHISELNLEIENLVQEIEEHMQRIDHLSDDIKRLKGENE